MSTGLTETQGDLFSEADAFVATTSKPMARRTDPQSSHEAAAEMVRSGTLGHQHIEVLGLVKHFPGNTSKNLSALGKADRYAVARRLPELAAMGLIRREDREQKETLWWPKGDE